MIRVFRYYISETISKSVANSQLFNWGDVLSENGLKSEFVIYYRSKEEVNKMTEDTTQPVLKIRVVKFFPLRNLIHFVSLLLLYFRARIKYNRIIFQSRAPGVSPSLALIRLLPGARVITDIRGFEIEQYAVNTKSGRLKLFNFDMYAKLSLYFADKIFCVSTPLVQLLSDRYQISNKGLFSVFGGVADENQFYHNNTLRVQMRREFGVENKILLLYSGMLNMPWQQPEKYFDFFRSLLKMRSDLLLVMLTPNVEIANDLKMKYNIEETAILIRESSYTDLVTYYNMADFGLLFRKDETVNRVASPTKFSEYALCGLPVIISDNIGDYSNYILKTGYGYVIRKNDSIESESDLIIQFINDKYSDRSKIASISKELFSKQSQISKLLSIYNSI